MMPLPAWAGLPSKGGQIAEWQAIKPSPGAPISPYPIQPPSASLRSQPSAPNTAS